MPNLHLPGLKSKEDANDEENALVHKQDTEPDKPVGREAQTNDPGKVLSLNNAAEGVCITLKGHWKHLHLGFTPSS